MGANVNTEKSEPILEPMSIIDILKLFWKKKLFLIAIVVLGALFGVFYSLSLPNIYRADSILSPSQSEQGGGLSSLASQFGGLASIAGVDLGGSNSNSITTTLEILKSRKFLIRFIDSNNLKVPIMAIDKWNGKGSSPEFVYNSDVYDNGNWLVDPETKLSLEPTMLETYNRLNELLTVSYSLETGLVNVSIEHYSPKLAFLWTELLINDINEYIREKDANEAQLAISYLHKQLDKTTLAGGKNLLYELLEEQEKKMMVTQISSEYVFQIIDPPYLPEEKAGPKRVLIVLISIFTATILGLFIIVFFHILSLFKLRRVK